MKFLHNLKQTLKLRYSELVLPLIEVFGGGLLGFVIMVIVNANIEDGKEYFPLGSIIGLSIFLMAMFWGFIFMGSEDFKMAISMGRTRKYFFWSDYITVLLQIIIALAGTELLAFLENCIYKAVAGQETVTEIYVLHFVPVYMLIALILAVPFVFKSLGMLYVKYGMMIFWIIWVIWMFCCLILPRLIKSVAKNDAFMERITKIFNENTAIVWSVIILLIGAVTAFVGYRLTQKESVKV